MQFEGPCSGLARKKRLVMRHNVAVNLKSPSRVRVEGSGSWAGGASPFITPTSFAKKEPSG
ncbi:hypothetical protein CH354_11185 [Leptospira levettii]|nr:hypothetical protein CH354_11185 [Leptospira levettii]